MFLCPRQHSERIWWPRVRNNWAPGFRTQAWRVLAWCWTLIPIQLRDQESMELCLHSLILFSRRIARLRIRSYIFSFPVTTDNSCTLRIFMFFSVLTLNSRFFFTVQQILDKYWKLSFKENMSGFFPWDLPVVKISPEWVTSPDQGRSSRRIATFSLWTGRFRVAFPPFLVKQLYRCDSAVISSFVRTGYTTRRWGWLLGRIGYSITHHCPLYPYTVQNVNRMPRNRLSRLMKYYSPAGRRNHGRHTKRLLDTWDWNGSRKSRAIPLLTL